MRISRRDFVLGAAMRGFAQEPTFSTDVKVVTLLATVHDRDGAIVTNLNGMIFWWKKRELRKPSGIFAGIGSAAGDRPFGRH